MYYGIDEGDWGLSFQTAAEQSLPRTPCEHKGAGSFFSCEPRQEHRQELKRWQSRCEQYCKSFTRSDKEEERQKKSATVSEAVLGHSTHSVIS